MSLSDFHVSVDENLVLVSLDDCEPLEELSPAEARTLSDLLSHSAYLAEKLSNPAIAEERHGG